MGSRLTPRFVCLRSASPGTTDHHSGGSGAPSGRAGPGGGRRDRVASPPRQGLIGDPHRQLYARTPRPLVGHGHPSRQGPGEDLHKLLVGHDGLDLGTVVGPRLSGGRRRRLADDAERGDPHRCRVGTDVHRLSVDARYQAPIAVQRAPSARVPKEDELGSAARDLPSHLGIEETELILP